MSNATAQVVTSRRRTIQRPRIHTEIVKYLLKDIQSGVYVEGQNLPAERTLMEEFGVGRPAVRESLAALGRMGLIEICPGMRAKVCAPTMKPLFSEVKNTLQMYSSTPEGWSQLHSLRMLFEIAITRELAHKITAEQLAYLRELLTAQATFLKHSELRSFAETDITFHSSLVEFTGNPLLSLLAEGFADWLMAPLLTSMEMYSRGEMFLAGHVEILAALEKFDPDLAEQAMREHMQQVNSVYLIIQQQGE